MVSLWLYISICKKVVQVKKIFFLIEMVKQIANNLDKLIFLHFLYKSINKVLKYVTEASVV